MGMRHPGYLTVCGSPPTSKQVDLLILWLDDDSLTQNKLMAAKEKVAITYINIQSQS